MGELLRQLEDAEAQVARLKQQIAQGPCREFGHDWQSFGGCNASCDEFCTCSVPVNVCSKCEDCDYGDNAEAEEVRAECARARSGEHVSSGDGR